MYGRLQFMHIKQSLIRFISFYNRYSHFPSVPFYVRENFTISPASYEIVLFITIDYCCLFFISILCVFSKSLQRSCSSYMYTINANWPISVRDTFSANEMWVLLCRMVDTFYASLIHVNTVYLMRKFFLCLIYIMPFVNNNNTAGTPRKIRGIALRGIYNLSLDTPHNNFMQEKSKWKVKTEYHWNITQTIQAWLTPYVCP